MISFSVTAFTPQPPGAGRGKSPSTRVVVPAAADRVVSQGLSRSPPGSLTDFGPGFMHLEPIGEHP
jgi:hypothetical protein